MIYTVLRGVRGLHLGGASRFCGGPLAPVPRQCSHPGLRRLQRRPDGPGRARRGGPAGPVPQAPREAGRLGPPPAPPPRRQRWAEAAGVALRGSARETHLALRVVSRSCSGLHLGPHLRRSAPRRRVQAVQSDLLGAHHELPHFAGPRHREAVGEADVLRNLAVRDPPPAELAAALLGGCRSVAELDPSEDLLSKALVRNADDVQRRRPRDAGGGTPRSRGGRCSRRPG